MASVVGRVGIEENWALCTSHYITCKEVSIASLFATLYKKGTVSYIETVCILSARPVL